MVNGEENVNDCGSVSLVVNEPRFLGNVRFGWHYPAGQSPSAEKATAFSYPGYDSWPESLYPGIPRETFHHAAD